MAPPRRDRNRPGAHRAEEDLQELHAIADDHADALPRLHTQALHQAGDAIRALVELRIGDLPLAPAMQVDDRYLVGVAADRIVEEVAEVFLASHFFKGVRAIY